jgi:hypothetical protein
MRESLRDSQHLIRAALLFAAALIAFLVVRAALIPEDFGRFGHYRGDALGEARAQASMFAGRAACAECHGDVADACKGGKHERIGCEACHGALAAHATDPTTTKPVRPDAGTICFVCHLQNVAKSEGFPQVDPKEHAGDESCVTCHKPHHPDFS